MRRHILLRFLIDVLFHLEAFPSNPNVNVSPLLVCICNYTYIYLVVKPFIVGTIPSRTTSEPKK